MGSSDAGQLWQAPLKSKPTAHPPQPNLKEVLKTMDYTDIVEISNEGVWGTNWKLEHGYKLLGWEAETFSARHPDKAGGGGGSFYSRCQIAYIVGRPSGVPEAPPTPPRPRREPPSDTTPSETPPSA